MGDFSAVFASRLRETRKRMEKSQREFAEMVGCTAATLSSYENGAKSPSLEIVRSIAEKCNISLDWLCGLDDKASERTVSEINTYSDLFSVLLNLDKKYPCLLGLDETDKENEEQPFAILKSYPLLRFDDATVYYFFRDWKKMKSLLENDSIDSEIYELWIEKTLRKFNEPISTKNLISEYVDLDVPF